MSRETQAESSSLDSVLQAVSKGLTEDVLSNVLAKLRFRYRVATWRQGGNIVTIWGPGGPRLKLRGLSPGVRGVRFFPLGDRLLTWTWGTAPVVWNATSGAPLREFRHHRRTCHVQIFPTDDRVVICDWGGGCNIWRPDLAEPLHSVSLWAPGEPAVIRTFVEVFPSGNRLLVWRMDAFRIVGADTGETVCQFGSSTLVVFYARVFPSEDRVAAGAMEATPGEAAIWDAKTCRPRRSLVHSPRVVVVDAVLLDGGRYLATLACLQEDPNDGVREVAIWNSETWEQLHVLPHPGPDFRLVPFPMGTRLVTVGKEAAVVWDAASGKCLHSLNGSEFDGVAIATGGDLLVITHEGGNVTFWDTASGDRLSRHRPSEEETGVGGRTEEQDWLDLFPNWRGAIGLGNVFDPHGLGLGLPLSALPQGVAARPQQIAW